ncbi:hypothetical protein N431DRAFT_451826 [Stipitochalara longipes BDJ]|nr:hypothetical protein N431DRAFT_451826 [Stipitochalara longipes BDJ]
MAMAIPILHQARLAMCDKPITQYFTQRLMREQPHRSPERAQSMAHCAVSPQIFFSGSEQAATANGHTENPSRLSWTGGMGLIKRPLMMIQMAGGAPKTNSTNNGHPLSQTMPPARAATKNQLWTAMMRRDVPRRFHMSPDPLLPAVYPRSFLIASLKLTITQCDTSRTRAHMISGDTSLVSATKRTNELHPQPLTPSALLFRILVHSCRLYKCPSSSHTFPLWISALPPLELL